MRFIGLLICFFCMFNAAKPVMAQDWLLVEARRLPNECREPVRCFDHSVSVLRNLFHLSSRDQSALLSTLNRLAMLRGVAEPVKKATVDLQVAVPVLHGLGLADKPALLANHPGVFFDSAKLDGVEFSAGFSKIIRDELSALGLRFLTEEEWEKTPGRPKLSVRYSARTEVEGCIVPFYVSFTLTEELALTRDPRLKINGTVWSATVRENLANKHYSPHSALRDGIEKFKADWIVANG